MWLEIRFIIQFIIKVWTKKTELESDLKYLSETESESLFDIESLSESK